MLTALILASNQLGACASKPNVPISTHADPLNCQTIPGNEKHERLCVMLTGNRGDIWFVMGNSGHVKRRFIDGLSFTGNGSATASFGEFSISPGGSYLAVTIAEEGHPTLLFKSLPQALQGHAESVDFPVISIYPGGISIEGWKSDNQLIVSSDQNLAHYQHGDKLGKSRPHLIHLPDGTITNLD